MASKRARRVKRGRGACAGLSRFASADGARHALRQLSRAGKLREADFQAYRCPACSQFHWGPKEQQS